MAFVPVSSKRAMPASADEDGDVKPWLQLLEISHTVTGNIHNDVDSAFHQHTRMNAFSLYLICRLAYIASPTNPTVINLTNGIIYSSEMLHCVKQLFISCI